MQKGSIFDIQRSSFVDGPGLRTTVFFKGCNLHCMWCHNPESQKSFPEMMFYENKCTGCGKCKAICPNGMTSCTLCGRCALYCPHDARMISGKEMTVDEVLREVLKDKSFYEASGGGVTFSGGECMLQIDFLAELAKACKESDIHTAVDTAGDVPWEHFEKMLPYTDLFLYDVKLSDREKHKIYTGAYNDRILCNLRKLSGRGSDILVRIPVIGGVNDTAGDMQAIAAILKECKISEFELLPYHRMGENKFAALGRKAETFTVPTAEQLSRFRNLFH